MLMSAPSSRRILLALLAVSVVLVVALLFVLTREDGEEALDQESVLRELEDPSDRSGGLNYLKLERMMRGDRKSTRLNSSH